MFGQFHCTQFVENVGALLKTIDCKDVLVELEKNLVIKQERIGREKTRYSIERSPRWLEHVIRGLKTNIYIYTEHIVIQMISGRRPCGR